MHYCVGRDRGHAAHAGIARSHVASRLNSGAGRSRPGEKSDMGRGASWTGGKCRRVVGEGSILRPSLGWSDGLTAAVSLLVLMKSPFALYFTCLLFVFWRSWVRIPTFSSEQFCSASQTTVDGRLCLFLCHPKARRVSFSKATKLALSCRARFNPSCQRRVAAGTALFETLARDPGRNGVDGLGNFGPAALSLRQVLTRDVVGVSTSWRLVLYTSLRAISSRPSSKATLSSAQRRERMAHSEVPADSLSLPPCVRVDEPHDYLIGRTEGSRMPLRGLVFQHDALSRRTAWGERTKLWSCGLPLKFSTGVLL